MYGKQRKQRLREIPDEIAKKLKTCRVSSCENWRDLTSFTTYHCFPSGDKNLPRWEIWTKLLRRARRDDSWIPTRRSLVCSHHFLPKDFLNDNCSQRRKLVPNAIPSIFPTFTVDLNDPEYQLPDIEEIISRLDYPSLSTEYNTTATVTVVPNLNQINEEGSTPSYENGKGDSTIECEFQVLDDDDVQLLEENPTLLPPLPSVQMVPLPIPTTTSSPTEIIKLSENANPSFVTSTTNLKSLSKLLSPPQTVTVQDQPKSNLTNLPKPLIIPSTLSSTTFQVVESEVLTPASIVQSSALNGLSVPSGNEATETPIDISKETVAKREDHVETIRALSLNPDLEIEEVDSAGVEDLESCRQRISVLEEEYRSLITMYSNEIESLRQNYEHEIQKLKSQLMQQRKLSQVSVSPKKKARLS